MLAKVRHESLYACYVLTESIEPNIKYKTIELNSIHELYESISWFNNRLTWPVKINNKLYTYGVCLLNKWCGFDDIHINKTIDKKQSNYISETIFEVMGKEYYYYYLTNLNRQLASFISFTKHSPTLNMNELTTILPSKEEQLFKKLPIHNSKLGIHLCESLTDRCINICDKNSSLIKLYKSGSRFSKSQLSRTCIAIGYSADENNKIVSNPVNSNLIKGITINDFFKGAAGTRKGVVDKFKETPNSGYLERTICMALSCLEIVEEDCGNTKLMEVNLDSYKYGTTLVDKWFTDTPDDLSTVRIFTKSDIDKYLSTNIYIRTPIHCLTPNNKLCKKCFGERYFPTNYVGITAGQVFSERLTQLIMRLKNGLITSLIR